MKIERVKIRNLGVLRDVALDLTALPHSARVVAVVGPNGSGKSTLLSLMTGGALYRDTGSRGTLTELSEWAGSRDSLLEVDLCHEGRPYLIRHAVDGVAKSGSSVVTNDDGSVVPACRDGKVSSFDAFAAATFPCPDVLYSSFVAQQRSDGLLDPALTRGERKAILLRALNVSRLEGMAEAARKRAQEAGETAKLAEAKLQVESERAGDVAQAKADLEEARSERVAAQSETTLMVELVEQARAEVDLAKLSADAWRSKSAEAEEWTKKASAARQLLTELTGRVDQASNAVTEATRSIDDLDPQLPGLSAEVERCRRWVAEVAEQTRILRGKKDAAAWLRNQLEQTTGRVTELSGRVTDNQRVLSESDAILRAVSEREGALRLANDLERQSIENSAQQRETLAKAMSAGQAARDAGKAAEAAQRRITALEAELVAAPVVERALAELPALEAARDDLRRIHEQAEAELERLRGQRVAGANERISVLRGGLQEIVDLPQEDDDRSSYVARGTLSEDDRSFQLSADLPASIVRKASEVCRTKAVWIEAEEEVARAVALASKYLRLEAAREELATAEHELELHRETESTQRRQANDMGATSKALALAVEHLSAQCSQHQVRAEHLKQLADKASQLANAETRLTELRPQFDAARAERQRIRTELDNLEVWFEANGEPDSDEPENSLGMAERNIDRANRLLAAARTKLAASEATARELEPQRLSAIAALDRLEIARLGLDEWLAQNTCPAVDLYAEVLQGSELALRQAQERSTDATAALAVAKDRHSTAVEAEGCIEALAAESAQNRQQQADWSLLGQDLGPNGLQAALIDAAGPQLTEIANDLLHRCCGPRFTVSFETTRPDSKGKRTLEDCDVRVYDAEAGRWKVAKRLSGGELALISLAVSLALTQLSCQRQGVRGCTLVRDESGAALDAERAPQYISMLRRAADAIGADRVLLVSHVPAVVDLCDARIEMAGGEARIA